MQKKISIGIPCFNEEGNVRETYERITEQIELFPQYDYEIVFSDNNSSDNTQKIIREICKKDKHVKAIFNMNNYGPERSCDNMTKRRNGDAYIAFMCDLQEPPELIGEFIREWEAGEKIVLAQKTKSKENKIKFLFRKIYYKILEFFSDVTVYENVTGVGITDKEVVEEIEKLELPANYPSMRTIFSQLGYDVKLISYTQKKRVNGKSSYSISSYFDFAINSMLYTSRKPIRITMIFGIICSTISFLVGLFYFVYKLLYWNTFDTGIAPLVIGVFLVGSIQIALIGLIGEYIGVVINNMAKQVPVVEKELINFEDENN
ncbi:MAG: glycosyltransferase family 2 protein [Lachnospiraceae bacterium]